MQNRRSVVWAFCTCFAVGSLWSCATNESDLTGFDADLASRLGADAYGMRSYVMVLLEAGEARAEDQSMTQELMDGHLANIARLADEGKMVVAGPFGSPSPYRGFFLFATDNLDTAQTWMNSDPAVQAGMLRGSFHPWYGSAALLETALIHKRIEQTAP